MLFELQYILLILNFGWKIQRN